MQSTPEVVVSDYLKDHGVKQKFVAQVLGVKDYTVSDMFCNRRDMKVNELVKICVATRTTPNEILAPLFEKKEE